jgi:hypothetical protein
MLANVLFPDWLVTVLLLGLLTFLTYKTARKAWSLHRCEVRYLTQQEEQSHRPARSGNRAPAADGPAPSFAEAVRSLPTGRPSPTSSSAVSAASCVLKTRDACLGPDGQRVGKEGQQPAALRQWESLEVEQLPSSLSSGEGRLQSTY